MHYFFIWPILDPLGRKQKIISFSFWFKWEQENLLLKFTDLQLENKQKIPSNWVNWRFWKHCSKNECTLIQQFKVLWNADFLAFHIVVILDLHRVPFNAVIVFLSENDYLFKSASTPCEENSQIPIRKRPGITIQENLFSNGPTIQETYSQMGLLSRKTYSKTGLLSRNVTPIRACTLENRTKIRN